jgi:glutathione S-transferase
MKLYYYPGACSLAAHIVLREAGYAFELDKVDLAAKITANGEDYRQVNGKGYVPALRLDNGQVLTEDAVILLYLAEHKPGLGLAPPAGTLEHYRLLEWLNFIATELHKTLGALYNPQVVGAWRDHQVALFGRRADWLEARLNGREWLMDEGYGIADAYLFTILNWCAYLKLDMQRWPALQAFVARVAARPAVRAAMQAEGLL